MRLPWTALQSSARERRWLQAARAAAVVGACLAVFALLRGDPPNLAGIAVVLLAALAVLARPRRQAAWLVGVADDGQVVARVTDHPPERHLRCVFASSWLITLRVGTRLVPVWPDALPPDAYRRLWVYVRWVHARPAGAVIGASFEP